MGNNSASVYFASHWNQDIEFLNNIRKQTPDESGKWGQMRAVTDPSAADYHVSFDPETNSVNPEKHLLFSAEPPCIPRGKKVGASKALQQFPLSSYLKPQRWFIDKTYDELVNMDPIRKTRDLSWITTDKGRDLHPIIGRFRRWLLNHDVRRHQTKDQVFLPGLSPITSRHSVFDLPTDGHILRMDFLDRLRSRCPDLLDLYGRGDFSGTDYHGEIDDKWLGLGKHRYTLAIENYSGPNYFSEKVTDALLSWCMPIYWGCTNLDEYLPEDSFIELDIEDPRAPDRVQEIVKSGVREKNLGAIAEARQRLLNEYQIWPRVEKSVFSLAENHNK